MPRTVVNSNVESLYVGACAATGYHFLVYHPSPNSTNGVGLYPDNENTGVAYINYNYIQPLTRVQSYSYDFNFPRENVTYLGKKGLHNNPVINKPTINLTFDYLQAGLGNEKNLGLFVNYPYIYTIPSNSGFLTGAFYSGVTPCVISGLLTKETDFRNIFIGQRNDYLDINYDSNLNKINTIAFGNCFLQGYKTQAAVGGFPTVNVSYICENMFFKTGCSGLAIPALTAKSGDLITNKGFNLMVVNNTTGSNLSAISPGDITATIQFSNNQKIKDIGYDISDAKLQAYSIDLSFPRESLPSIGYVLPLDRRINLPVFANLDFNYIVGDLETGNMKWQWFHDTEYNININLKNPSCPSFGALAGQTAIQYSFLKAKINSKNESAGVGKRKISSVSFITELDPDDLTKGLFISGLLNYTENQIISHDPNSPYLTCDGVNVTWTWNFADPIYWHIETSSNSISWSQEAEVVGTTRTRAMGAATNYYRVVGSDGAANTTNISNIIVGT